MWRSACGGLFARVCLPVNPPTSVLQWINHEVALLPTQDDTRCKGVKWFAFCDDASNFYLCTVYVSQVFARSRTLVVFFVGNNLLARDQVSDFDLSPHAFQSGST